MRKISILIAVTAALLAIFCAVSCLTMGDTVICTAINTKLAAGSGWQDIPDNMKVIVDNEGIVEVEAVKIYDDYIRFRVRAAAPGETSMRCLVDDETVFYSRLRSYKVPGHLFLLEGEVNFRALSPIIAAVGLFLAVMFVLFFIYFIRARGTGFYSYLSIFSVGFAIFNGAGAVSVFLAVASYLSKPFHYTAYSLCRAIANTAGDCLWFMAVPILVFSLAMIISNIELLRHERFRLANVLGIIIPLILIAGLAFFIFLKLQGFEGSYEEYRVRETLEAVYAAVYVYFGCMLAGSVICGIKAAKHKAACDKDYIIILGCRFRKDGSLTPLLKGRCDRAISFWKEQKEKTGCEAVFIPSGGQGADETMAEAEAMSRYLLDQGIPEKLIRKENRSANTYQNMVFSREITEAEKPGARVAFSTTNYHVFRSGVWAAKAGLDAEGIGSRTRWWFWPNAFMRECIGLIRNRIREEIALLVIIIAVSTLLTYFTTY